MHWQNWDFHLSTDSRVGPIISTVTYNDNGKKRQVMYQGSLGGMIVPYGDPDIGWYFKAYGLRRLRHGYPDLPAGARQGCSV